MTMTAEPPKAYKTKRFAFPAPYKPLLPPSPEQPLPQFLYPFVFIESPRGSLKTCSILNLLMGRAYIWPGLRWYIWRSTRTLLSTTVLPSFEEYVLPAWADIQGMRLTNPNARPGQRTEYLF